MLPEWDEHPVVLRGFNAGIDERRFSLFAPLGDSEDVRLPVEALECAGALL